MNNQAEQVRAFAAQLLALAAALPVDAELQRIGAALRTIAAEADGLLTLAVCGDFADHPLLIDRLLGESERKPAMGRARAVVLLRDEDSSLLALGPRGTVYRESQNEQIALQSQKNPSTLCRALAKLLLNPEKKHDSILAYSRNQGAAQDGAGESAIGFLNRADALVWVLSGTAISGSERPVEFQVFSNQEDSVLLGSSPSVIRLLRDAQKQPLLDSRLAQMSEAVEQLRWSDTVRNQLLLHAVARCGRWWSMLAECFATRAEEMRGTPLPRQLAELRARRKNCQSELQRWEGRWADPAVWLTDSEEQDDLPAELQEQLSKLRAEDIALAKEQLRRQREEIRSREEQRYVERRREEAARNLEDLKQGPGPSRSMEERQSIEREAKLAQLAWEQWSAEDQTLTQQAASLIRREAEQAERVKEFPQLVLRVVRQGALGSDQQIAELRATLRKQRWRVQASAEELTAAAAVAAAAAALERMVEDLRGDASAEAGVLALRRCRKSCESLARLRATTGQEERLRLYRRMLSRQVRAARVRNYSELLAALEAASSRVPLTELWRELQLSPQQNSALGRFAEGLVGWLCHGEGAAARAGSALAATQPSAEALTEVLSFAERHGGERQEEFLAAVLDGDPAMKRVVLRSAPRSSEAYRRALLGIGYELMTSIEMGSATYG